MKVIIDKVLFTNKQNIPWNDVETYMKKYLIVRIKINNYIYMTL